MLIHHDHVAAEHAYRVEARRRDFQAASQPLITGRGRHLVAAVGTALLASAALVVGVGGQPSGAAGSPTSGSWIADNWEALEPTWEPNRSALAQRIATSPVACRPEDGCEVGPPSPTPVVEPVTRIAGPQ